MRGPIPGRRRLHDAEFEWRPRTWTQALQASRVDDEGRCTVVCINHIRQHRNIFLRNQANFSAENKL